MAETVTISRRVPNFIEFRNGDILVFSGAQGTPGPAQIYDQATAPDPVPGYILLWFQSGVSADPDDRELNLVVSP